MIASLPMYDWPELKAETDRFWKILARHFDKAGFEVPRELTRGTESTAHWLREDLLFSQTCGYPFATKLLGKVHLLGTPHYNVEGCEGAYYSSAILVRSKSEYKSLEQALKGKFAFNGRDSLSGYRCLTPLVGDIEGAFAEGVESGGHRQSAKMVARGEADVTALDAVCWDLYQRFEIDDAKKLRVLAWTPKLPALPYITNGNGDEKELTLMRMALAASITEAMKMGAGNALRMGGVSVLPERSYVSLREL